MAQPGYATTVKVSGTAVAVTGEAMTDSGDQLTFQITNTAKRIIDPNAAILAKDNGADVNNIITNIDYLFGTVTFSSARGGPVTLDFSYLPVNTIAEVKKANFTRSRNLLDSTVFKTTPERTRIAGLMDLKGSLDGLAFVGDDLDSGVGGVQSIQSFFDAGTPKLLEIRPGGSGDYFRAWILFPNLGDDVAADGLRETKIDFEGTAIAGSGQSFGAAAGWGT